MLLPSTEHSPGSRRVVDAGLIHAGLVARAPQSGMGLLLAHGRPVSAPDTTSRRFAIRVKRSIDAAFAGLALVALAPALLLIAGTLLIVQGRPVFAGGHRLGLGGEPFLLHEFRTRDGAGPTRIGVLMRRTGLHALPRIINVFEGELSLVGPEPHAPQMQVAGEPYDAIVPYYRMRVAMRPGLIGWAQVNGCEGPASDGGGLRALVDHDIAYIQNFSLLLDARILMQALRGASKPF